ncbi:CobW family GTP-binding protein [Solwaraspora sp. WMMB335]|uniref:CobW family GTP-binding protein n=1 Tax=Solwaraspora sp. WMMB335 TaxID=3404118 RepID=UPI003B93AF53
MLNGFLGSGKTTLLQSLLVQSARATPRPRVAAIVNEMSELDVDGLIVEETEVLDESTLSVIVGGSIHGPEQLKTLLAETDRLLADPHVDHLFIETSGSTRPWPLVKALARHPRTRLHAWLSVLDAAMLRDDLDHGRAVTTGLSRHLRNGTQGLESLIAEQVMFASAVYLSKADKLSREELQTIGTALHPLNPYVPISSLQFGNLPLGAVIDAPPYDQRRVAGLGREIEKRDRACPDHAYIASLLLDDPRPFHPQRLWDTYTTKLPQTLYRSKGTFWLPTRDDQVLLWNQAAGGINLEFMAYWKAGVLAHDEGRLSAAEIAHLQTKMAGSHAVFGDRRTQLTLLGVEAETRAFLTELEACLCTPDEVEAWRAGRPFDDPWPTQFASLDTPP